MKTLGRGFVALVLAATGAVVAAPQPAGASDNGLAQTPPLGWSSWSFVRREPTAAKIMAQADAMKSSGLADVGFRYVNLDDFYYLCPGSQGPDVDQFGRWVTDPAKFPPDGATDGIKVVADHVHGLGLKFGVYVTPGISKQAVARNTPIEGTPFHAADIATDFVEKNYNCRGMVGIDYAKPGAQEFVNSWANLFASWGADYLKIDGVGLTDVPDIEAWSKALRQTGRPMHLELSNNLAISGAATWKQLANGWRTSGDVECYCGPGPNGSGFPLTDWGHVQSRFNQVASWQPFAGPGGWNDYDSLELGNGMNTGLTLDERKAHMSLWALGASPFILGTDLTNLDPTDLTLLKNREVLAVDQDAIAATRIVNTPGQQVFTKTEPNGDAIVGLFNLTTSTQVVATTAAAVGLPAADGYLLDDLWSHAPTGTSGAIAANVPAHGVMLYRVRPSRAAAFVPPSVTLAVSGLDTVTAGVPSTVTTAFTNNGLRPVQRVDMRLSTPDGWTVTPTSANPVPAVVPGQTAQATFQVVKPPVSELFETATLTATADYRWPDADRTGSIPTRPPVPTFRVTSTQLAVTALPILAPYQTFSSTTAAFSQLGTRFGIRAGGRDVYGSANQYGAVYLPGAEQDGTVAVVQVTAQENTNAFAKAGIMVRNTLTNANAGTGFVILAVTPGHGYVLQWDANGDGQLESNSAPSGQGTGTAVYPSWLKLVRSGTAYTGYYSTDGTTWTWLYTASVPTAAATQDVGVFATAHNTGAIGEADFDHFTLASQPGALASYEAEAPANVLGGAAAVRACPTCSGTAAVGGLGAGATVTFTGVTAPAAGSYRVTFVYLDGAAPSTQATMSVNGGPPQAVPFPASGNPYGVTVSLPLAAGDNTVAFGNPAGPAPDLDRILVSTAPG